MPTNYRAVSVFRHHVVSIVNPAQIRDFARTKLGRNKTDKVDAALIREYVELFKPGPWVPPSVAMRRLCELPTIRGGIVSNRAEWKNRIGSGLTGGTATTRRSRRAAGRARGSTPCP